MNSYIISAKRTAVSPRGGTLGTLSIHELAAPVIDACLIQSGIEPHCIDEVIVGNALGAGGNPARLIALASGLPETIAGLTIDRQCCSGLDAIALADHMIKSGCANIVLAGGVESYSLRPQRYRVSPELAAPQAYDQPPFTPWPDKDPDMAEAADALSIKLGIDAHQQSSWAIESHRKALMASATLRQEIVEVNGLNADSFTRKLTPGVCSKARKITGSITVANTAVAADAAAFCVVVSGAVARKLDTAKMRIVGAKTVGADPEFPGAAPVAAMQAVMKSGQLSVDQLQCAEIMEAYAAQAIACTTLMGMDPKVVNIGGGALARGHPIGASGAILAVRLFSELSLTGGYGLAAIAAAGGLGSAMLLHA